MNVTDFLLNQIASISLVTVAGFMAKSFITRAIDRRADRYKSDLARELEDHKSNLQRENDRAAELLRNMGTTQVEKLKADLQHENNQALEHLRNASAIQMERLRADLRPVAYAAEVQAAELLKRRADVIAEVYRMLAIAQFVFTEVIKPFERAGEAPREAKAKAAADGGRAFLEYYDQHKVFLPADVCELLDHIAKTLTIAWLNFTRYGYDWPQGIGPESDAKYKSQEDAWRAIEHEVPPAREKLEAALRALLGDTPPENAA